MCLQNVNHHFFVKSKVLFICKGHQNIAGAQLYLKQMFKVFPSDKYNLHYAFQAKDGTRVFDEIEKQRFIHKWEYDWRHLSFVESFQHASVLLNKIHPEFIIFNSNEDEIIPPLLAAQFCGVKNKTMVVHWALDEHSLPVMVKRERLPFAIPSRYALKIRVKRFIAYTFLDKLIFVNNRTRKAFIKLYKVNSNKCTTIYNGINADKFYLDNVRESVREELGVGENEIMLLATGNLTPVKGHEVLIAAVKELANKGMSIKCFIAGQGELKDVLNQKIVDDDLSLHVQLLGYRDDVARLIAAADIFCMPSLNEALGYSLIEAMAAGKPVVASMAGGIPEVITDGKEGLLVPPKNVAELVGAIENLALNSKLRCSMGKAGRETAKKRFSLNTMLAQTKKVLIENLNAQKRHIT